MTTPYEHFIALKPGKALYRANNAGYAVLGETDNGTKKLIAVIENGRLKLHPVPEYFGWDKERNLPCGSIAIPVISDFSACQVVDGTQFLAEHAYNMNGQLYY